MTTLPTAPDQERLARFLTLEAARQASHAFGRLAEPALLNRLARSAVADLLRTRPAVLDFVPALAVRRIGEILRARRTPAEFDAFYWALSGTTPERLDAR